jgi:hypothetical protein
LTNQYVTPTANPSAGSTNVAGKSIRAPENGRTDTISARQRMTVVTKKAETAYEMTQPAEPAMLMSWLVFVQIPVPTVPEKAIPGYQVRVGCR